MQSSPTGVFGVTAGIAGNIAIAAAWFNAGTGVARCRRPTSSPRPGAELRARSIAWINRGFELMIPGESGLRPREWRAKAGAVGTDTPVRLSLGNEFESGTQCQLLCFLWPIRLFGCSWFATAVWFRSTRNHPASHTGAITRNFHGDGRSVYCCCNFKYHRFDLNDSGNVHSNQFSSDGVRSEPARNHHIDKYQKCLLEVGDDSGALRRTGNQLVGVNKVRNAIRAIYCYQIRAYSIDVYCRQLKCLPGSMMLAFICKFGRKCPFGGGGRRVERTA